MALTPFEKLAKERGVDLKAEQERAKGQIERGEPIGGVSKSTKKRRKAKGLPPVAEGKVASVRPIDQPTIPLAQEQPSIEPIRLTQQTVDKILSGQLQTTPETLEAVQAGNYQIDKIETAKVFLGIESLGLEHYLTAIASINTFRKLPGLVKPAIGQIQTTLPGTQINTKAAKLSTNWLTKIISGTNSKTITTVDPATGRAITKIVTTASGVSPQKIAGIIVSASVGYIGTKAWAQHLKVDNLIGGLSIASRDAREAAKWEKDPIKRQALIDIGKKAQAMLDDVLNPSTWDKILENIPGVNVIKVASEVVKISTLTNEINRAINNNLDIQVETGETDEEANARVQAQEIATYQASVDLTNQKKLETNDAINTANAKAADIQRQINKGVREERAEDELKVLKETIKFWEDKRERDEASAREETIWLAEYWLAYYKLRDKMSQDNRPSNLNFGLI